MANTSPFPNAPDRMPPAAIWLSAAIVVLLVLAGVVVAIWGSFILQTNEPVQDFADLHWSRWSSLSALFMIPGAIALAIMLIRRAVFWQRTMLVLLSIACATSFVAAAYAKIRFDGLRNADLPNDRVVAVAQLRLNLSLFIGCTGIMGMILSFTRQPPMTTSQGSGVAPPSSP